MTTAILQSFQEFRHTSSTTLLYGNNTFLNKSDHFSAALEEFLKLRIDPASPHLANVTDPYSKLSLECMMNNLECFSKIHLMVFCTKEVLGDDQLHAPTLTREFGLNAILQQVEIDANAIMGLIKDREGTSSHLTKLKILDEEANKMIQAAVTANIFDTQPSYVAQTPHPAHNIPLGVTRDARPTPLVHFSGASKLRMIPYCPVAPLSLPLDLIAKGHTGTDLEIWLKPALAYEVGRLIFWKGSMLDSKCPDGKPFDFYMNRSKFSRYLGPHLTEKGYSNWVADAVSNIFADVFMTIQCGENALGHAIRRAIARKLERFHAEDLRYQLPPLLRVEVVIKTLDLMGVTPDPAIMSEWNTLKKEIYGSKEITVEGNMLTTSTSPGLPRTVIVYTENGPLTIQYNAAIREIDQVIAKVYYPLLKNLTSVASSLDLSQIVDTRITTPAPATSQWGYGEWQDGDKWMKQVNKIGDLTVPHPQGLFWAEGWFGALSVETRQMLIQALAQARISETTYHEHFEGQKYYWVTSLYAGGWTMESPGNTNPPY